MWLTYLLDNAASLMDSDASRCVCVVKKLTETIVKTKKKKRERNGGGKSDLMTQR